MTKLPFASVVFDLDGTLIDSVPDVAAALNRLMADEKRRALSVTEVQGLVGEGVRPLVFRAFALTGQAIEDEAVSDAVSRYLEYYAATPADHTIVFDGVRDVLDILSQQGFKLAICTNKPYQMTLLVLRTLKLEHYFQAVTGGDNVAHNKPDGRHILDTLALIDGKASEAVYVGDSATDVAAAKDAKLPMIAVSYGYARIDPSKLGADLLIEHFAHLPDAIRQLGGRG